MQSHLLLTTNRKYVNLSVNLPAKYQLGDASERALELFGGRREDVSDRPETVADREVISFDNETCDGANH